MRVRCIRAESNSELRREIVSRKKWIVRADKDQEIDISVHNLIDLRDRRSRYYPYQCYMFTLPRVCIGVGERETDDLEIVEVLLQMILKMIFNMRICAHLYIQILATCHFTSETKIPLVEYLGYTHLKSL